MSFSVGSGAGDVQTDNEIPFLRSTVHRGQVNEDDDEEATLKKLEMKFLRHAEPLKWDSFLMFRSFVIIWTIR